MADVLELQMGLDETPQLPGDMKISTGSWMMCDGAVSNQSLVFCI